MLLVFKIVESLQCVLKVLFKTTNKFNNYFRFKNPVFERSNRIYKFSSRGCTASFIGKTDRYRKVQVSEHQGVSQKTGKPVKGTLLTSVRGQMLLCDHQVAWENFKIIVSLANLLKEINQPFIGIKPLLF